MPKQKSARIRSRTQCSDRGSRIREDREGGVERGRIERIERENKEKRREDGESRGVDVETGPRLSLRKRRASKSAEPPESQHPWHPPHPPPPPRTTRTTRTTPGPPLSIRDIPVHPSESQMDRPH